MESFRSRTSEAKFHLIAFRPKCLEMPPPSPPSQGPYGAARTSALAGYVCNGAASPGAAPLRLTFVALIRAGGAIYQAGAVAAWGKPRGRGAQVGSAGERRTVWEQCT